MKAIATVATGLLLAGTALSALGMDRSDAELAVCAARLQSYYGAGVQIRVVDRQRGLYGTHLKVAARIDDGTAHFATCWVDTREIAALLAPASDDQLAVVEKPGR